MKTTPSKTSTAPAAEDDREEQPPTSAAAGAVARDGSPSAGEKNGASDPLAKADPLAEADPLTPTDPLPGPGAPAVSGAGTGTDGSGDVEDLDGEHVDEEDDDPSSRSVGSGAGAVVSAALGVVGLVGGWSGKVASERETLIGQIKTSGGGSAARQVSEIYGDSWHATALVNGLFAVLALLVGVFVLVRPAFGTPSTRPQPSWIRSVALGGVVLGAFGVVLSIAMYFDLIVGLPNAS